MTEFKMKMSTWEESFNSYLENELKCTNKINLILEIKNNLTKLIGNQRKDDILFYKSIIDNSYYYYTKSLNVRKIKFIKDLSFIYTKLDDRKAFIELNKVNFSTLLKDFANSVDSIKIYCFMSIIRKRLNFNLLCFNN
jgi:aspartate/tyrosine/aromatic aminotransferase